MHMVNSLSVFFIDCGVAPFLPAVPEPRTGTRRRRQHHRLRARHQRAPQGSHLAGRHQLVVPRHGASMGLYIFDAIRYWRRAGEAEFLI